MADKELRVRLEADDKITPAAKKAADALKKLEKPVEITADVDQALRQFDDLLAEVKQIDAAADALGSALGPELAAKADTRGIVVDLRQMGVTLDEIKGNADQFAAKLKELSDADVGGKLGANLGTTRGKMDELSDSARGANSAMANMVGNVSQDLGALSGVAGSAGVALGQMGEYAADAAFGGEKLSAALGSMVKVAGPIAAMAVVLQTFSTIMGGIKAEKAFEAALVKDFTAALKEGKTVAQDIYETLKETGELKFETGALGGGGMAGLGSQTKDLIPIFEQLGFSTNEWLNMLDDPRGSAERMIAQMEAMGTSSVDQQLLMEQAAEGLLSYAEAGEKAKLADERRLEIAKELKPVFDEFAGGDFARSTEDQADATSNAAREMASYERTMRETAEAARALMTTEQEAADMRRGLADSTFAYRDAQRDFAQSLIDTTAVLADGDTTALEAAAALDEFGLSAGRAADEAKRLEADQMTAAGATQSAAQAQATWNKSMIASARTTSGPMQQAIVDYIAIQNGIPAEKVTEILADPDYATIDAAQAAIEQAAADQTALITAQAQAAEADRIINEVAARKRTAVINVIAVASENAAYGGSSAQRPRSVEPAPAGMSTYTAAVPAAAMSPVTYPITVRVPAPVVAPSITIQAGVIGNRFDVDRTVTRALRRHRRLNGERE